MSSNFPANEARDCVSDNENPPSFAPVPRKWEGWVKGIGFGIFILAAVGLLGYAAFIRNLGVTDWENLRPFVLAIIGTAVLLLLLTFGRRQIDKLGAPPWIGSCFVITLAVLFIMVVAVMVIWFAVLMLRDAKIIGEIDSPPKRLLISIYNAMQKKDYTSARQLFVDDSELKNMFHDAGIIGEIDLPSKRVLIDFYGAIQTKNYNAAWQLLADDSGLKRNIVSPEKFADGYRYTLSISNLNIALEKKASDSVHEYLVYYLDVIDCPIFDELRDLHKLPLAKLDEFRIKLSQLRDRVIKAGFKGETLDQLNFHQLFSPNSGDKLRWLLSRDANIDTTSLYNGTENVSILKGYRVFVQKYNDKWLIRRLQELQASPR